MSVISDITGVIGLATKAVELADKVKNLDLKELIVDLKGKLIDLKAEIVELRQENVELKRKIAEAPVASASPKNKPEIRDGMYYFDGEGPFCTGCYDSGEKKSRLSEVSSREARMLHIRRRCPVCKATFTK